MNGSQADAVDNTHHGRKRADIPRIHARIERGDTRTSRFHAPVGLASSSSGMLILNHPPLSRGLDLNEGHSAINIIMVRR